VRPYCVAGTFCEERVKEHNAEFVARKFVKVGVYGLCMEGQLKRRAALQDVLDLLNVDADAPQPPAYIEGTYIFTHGACRAVTREALTQEADKGPRTRDTLSRAKLGMECLTPLLDIINKTTYHERIVAVERALTLALERRAEDLAYGVLLRRRHKRWLDKIEILARKNGASKIELVELTRNDNLCSWLEFRGPLAANAKSVHENLVVAGIESTFIPYHHGHKGPAVRFRIPDARLEESK
jgi:hypothetical protein